MPSPLPCLEAEMGDREKLYRVCPQCNGVGKLIRRNWGAESQPIVWEITCPNCKGEKLVLWGESENSSAIADLQDTCNDIMDKCNDIWEKINEVKPKEKDRGK